MARICVSSKRTYAENDVLAHKKLPSNTQGSYTSGKCQGNLIFFKVVELSMNSVMCQEKKKFCKNFISQPVEARIFGPNISFFLHSSNFWLQYCQKSLNLYWENIRKMSGNWVNPKCIHLFAVL